MKANNIKALDYLVQGDTLTLTLGDTSLKEIIAMDTALVRVTTDDNDPVEAFAGYQLVRATYEAEKELFVVVLTRQVPDSARAALEALAAENTELHKRLDEQADGLIELAELVAGGGEV